MRPQGFLGRLIARRLSTEHALDPDPRYWSGENVLQYLVRYGTDEIGDLVDCYVNNNPLDRVQGASGPNSPRTFVTKVGDEEM